jgi:hypothetical protein
MTPPGDEHSVPFPCPNCGTKIETTVGWLQHNNRIDCGCGARLNIDNSALRAGLAAADRPALPEQVTERG